MKQKGFTLIEIIVVISLIALLSVIGLTAFNRVQRNARDSKRLGDIKELQNGLMLYKAVNGVFPPNNDNDCYGWDTSADDSFINVLLSTRSIDRLITDPLDDVSLPCGGHASTAGFNYFYYKYAASYAQARGCSQARPFIIIGVGDMESSDAAHPQSPGFSCPGNTQPAIDWHDTLDYVIAIYE